MLRIILLSLSLFVPAICLEEVDRRLDSFFPSPGHSSSSTPSSTINNALIPEVDVAHTAPNSDESLWLKGEPVHFAKGKGNEENSQDNKLIVKKVTNEVKDEVVDDFGEDDAYFYFYNHHISVDDYTYYEDRFDTEEIDSKKDPVVVVNEVVDKIADKEDLAKVNEALDKVYWNNVATDYYFADLMDDMPYQSPTTQKDTIIAETQDDDDQDDIPDNNVTWYNDDEDDFYDDGNWTDDEDDSNDDITYDDNYNFEYDDSFEVTLPEPENAGVTATMLEPLDPPDQFIFTLISNDVYYTDPSEDEAYAHLHKFFDEMFAITQQFQKPLYYVGQSLSDAVEKTIYEWIENLMIMCRWGSFESESTASRRYLRGNEEVINVRVDESQTGYVMFGDDVDAVLQGYNATTASFDKQEVVIAQDDTYYTKDNYILHPERYTVDMPLTTFFHIMIAIFIEGCLICLLCGQLYETCKMCKPSKTVVAPVKAKNEHVEDGYSLLV